jgi:hypothetical protein
MWLQPSGMELAQKKELMVWLLLTNRDEFDFRKIL